MSAPITDWREHRQKRIDKRNANKEAATAKLTELGIEFASRNGGLHLIVQDRWDYFPSTGKYIDRRATGPHGTGRGLRNFIRALDKEANAPAV